jgi:signal peptidase I
VESDELRPAGPPAGRPPAGPSGTTGTPTDRHSPPAAAPRRRGGRSGGWLRRWLEALLIAVLFMTFVATSVGIEGGSMEPTLSDGERALVPRFETWAVRGGLKAWQPGDVVYFRSPSAAPRTLLERLTGGPFLIKRVVAVEGQLVELRRGVLMVDGRAVEAGAVGPLQAAVSAGPTLVPEDHLYVLGDNRSPLGSHDSRAFGPVPVSSVAGRASWVVWPPIRDDANGGRSLNVRPIPRLRSAASAEPSDRQPAERPGAPGAVATSGP